MSPTPPPRRQYQHDAPNRLARYSRATPSSEP